MKRGIIASIGRTIRIDSKTLSFSPNLNKTDINYYTLYWDKIIIPNLNIFNSGVPHQKELFKTGILERPLVNFKNYTTHEGKGFYDIYSKSQSIIANQLLSIKSDVDWTIHQIGEEVIIADGFRKEFQSIKVGLLNCLPVPTDEINPELILEFKNTRKDELANLHQSIDELYFVILNSPDPILQQKITESELTKAIEDLEKTVKEHFKRIGKYNFTTEINLSGKDIFSAATKGLIMDYFSHGIEFPILTILSGLASMISIKANKTTSFESSKDKLKLYYLANASKEGIIKL